MAGWIEGERLMFNSMLMRNMMETGQPDSCPRATQDLELNLKNRQNAIDTKMYGPANPQLDETGANEDFWQAYADMFNDTIENVMQMRCGNCSFFDRSEGMLECIAKGIGDEADPEMAVDAGELGYCQALDFKCASMRVCKVWAGRV
jgi:hypothetical protein|tara:strand:- start:185 stop:625 length:441 start_codon:yes stop_codon:yes gene_type:complete